MARKASFHERDLIRWLRQSGGPPGADVVVDTGDDAAVVRPRPGRDLIVTTDCLVDGIHFTSADAGPRLAGRKAVMRAASDVAAMAGEPRWIVAALCLPPGLDPGFVKAFCNGMRWACGKLEARLIGGDVSGTTGPLTAVVTVIGETGPGGTPLRSGARPGDAVCVTGTLGGSLLGRHLRFVPRVQEARRLVERFDIHALIDLSDGLSTDANHLAEESGARIRLDAGRIPVSAAARRLAAGDGRTPLWHAVNDGEDYELLFALPSDQAKALLSEKLLGTKVTRIGLVETGRGVVVERADGRCCEVKSEGWEHRL